MGLHMMGVRLLLLGRGGNLLVHLRRVLIVSEILL